MPRAVALPEPPLPAWMSLWYHETPKGLFGTWMTNRSKSLFFGMPHNVTFMTSLSDPGVTHAWPWACGRHLAIPGEGTSLKEKVVEAGARRSAGRRVAAPAGES